MNVINVAVFLILWGTYFSQSSNTKELVGIFFETNFQTKKGSKSGIKDLYFRTDKEMIFIKRCESQVDLPLDIHLQKVLLRLEIKKGNWDSCDSNMAQSRYGIYAKIIDAVLESEFYFSISDGSGNVYQLMDSILSYTPVEKTSSSSGFYDGGVKMEKILDVNDRRMIVRKFKKTFQKDKMISNGGAREMGTIRIQFNELGEDQPVVSYNQLIWDKYLMYLKKKLK